jgi:hypothetical protein
VDQGQLPGSKPNFDTREEAQAEREARYRSRERLKLAGLFVVVLFILALAFFRFGKTIPWGAR